jgi:hypothetical protein
MICSKIVSNQGRFKGELRASLRTNLKNSSFQPFLPKDGPILPTLLHHLLLGILSE